MEHLPPVGWADVATKRDLDQQTKLLRTEVKGEFDVLRAELRHLDVRLTALDEGLNRRITNLDDRAERRITTLDEGLNGRITTLDDRAERRITTLDKGLDRRIEGIVQGALHAQTTRLMSWYAASQATMIAAIGVLKVFG